MNDIISDTADKLSSVTGESNVNWEAFDAILNETNDINIYDVRHEETILSEFVMSGDFYKRGSILPDIVRHFLSCGYDVAANDGLNGSLALQALCWSSYDQYILGAAKILMDAGAPVNYKSNDNDSDDKHEGLTESIGLKLSGAWTIDKDFAFANTLEAYYAMAEANIAGKDYNSVDSYFACIGKSLTFVSAISIEGKPALYSDGATWVYSEPLIMQFEDKPLVINCCTALVVNPVYADDKKDELSDITALFSPLVGAIVQDVQYSSATVCCFEFGNNRRLLFSSHGVGNGKRVGTFDIQVDSKAPKNDRMVINREIV